jgi:mannose-6-phosphate isomerase-like protein (cupin superfamily)
MAKIILVFYVLTAASAFMIAAAGQGVPPNAAAKKMQSGAPSSATQPYLLLTGTSLRETIQKLQSGNGSQNLMSADPLSCRVYIQHEKDVTANPAEVHDGADDIFLILEGTATYILGGTLDAPQETQPGEWRAPSIANGKEYKLVKGDMLIVPRGTPHRRTTAGLDATFMVIKAFAPIAK